MSNFKTNSAVSHFAIVISSSTTMLQTFTVAAISVVPLISLAPAIVLVSTDGDGVNVSFLSFTQ
jgi:hypothetical protein